MPTLLAKGVAFMYHGTFIKRNNKGRFFNNSEMDALISKRLSVENKAKLSQLEIVNKQYCEGGVLSFLLR